MCSSSEQRLNPLQDCSGPSAVPETRGNTVCGLLTAPVPELGVSGVPEREYWVDLHFALPCSAPKISLWSGELLRAAPLLPEQLVLTAGQPVVGSVGLRGQA